MKDLNYYMNLPYEIIVRKLSSDEGGGYFASYKDFPYIMGDGENEIEAITDVKKAFKFVIETDLTEGKAIKEPKQKTDKTKNLAITLKESILNKTDQYAKELGISRSAFVSKSIENYISSLNIAKI